MPNTLFCSRSKPQQRIYRRELLSKLIPAGCGFLRCHSGDVPQNLHKTCLDQAKMVSQRDRALMSCALELKLIDIFRGNDHRGAKNNLAIFTDRIVAKPARCKCLALLASYFALGISLRGIIS